MFLKSFFSATGKTLFFWGCASLLISCAKRLGNPLDFVTSDKTASSTDTSTNATTPAVAVPMFYAVKLDAEVPTCTATNEGWAYSIESTKKLKVCRSNNWTEVDITGPKGDTGATGPAGSADTILSNSTTLAPTITTAAGLVSLGTLTSLKVSGNVGVGITSPQTPMHIKGYVRQTSSDETFPWTWQISTGADQIYLNSETANAIRFTVNADGNVGIGTSSPTTKLDVNGTAKISGAITTIPIAAGYSWSTWNPTDLVGTQANASSTGQALEAPSYMTLSNSNGTLTVTFKKIGNYLITINASDSHATTYTHCRVITYLGGTATRFTPKNQFAGSGDSPNDLDFTYSMSFMVTATAVDQTLTILPMYDIVAIGTVSQHTAAAFMTAMYTGTN